MKVAIVTGGSNGIGKSTALEFGKRGVGVILTYRSDKYGAEEVVREIERRHGVKAIALKLDLAEISTFEDFSLIVRNCLEGMWNRKDFDFLINNGGTGGPCMFPEITNEFYNKIFDTNFKGPFFLTQKLLPLLVDGGRIVNTASSASHGSFPGYSVYGPSKAAVVSWTKYLAKELAPRKIRVNSVSPGPTLTNFGDGAFAKHPEFIQPLAEQTALGKIGDPADVANVIVNLVSDEMGWITGQDIEASGGHLL